MSKIFIMIINLFFAASATFASPSDYSDTRALFTDSSMVLVGNILVGVEILMVWYLLSHLKIFRKSFGFLILIAIFLRFVFNNSIHDQSVGILVFLVDIIFVAFLSYIVLAIHKLKKRKNIK